MNLKLYPLSSSTNTPQPASQHQTPEVTGLLLQRIVQFEKLQDELTRVIILPKKSVRAWLLKHQDYIYEMLERTKHESHGVLQHNVLSGDVKSQFTDYVLNIQQTLLVLEQIVNKSSKKKTRGHQHARD